MKSLLYLMMTTIKNRIKDLKKHPSKLILFIFVILMLGLAIASTFFTEPSEIVTYRPISELYAIILALYTLIFTLGALQGLSSGSSFFSIADVQLVFPAPISPRRVLVYGLIKQMSTSLFVGFFILYQYSWVYNNYGISFFSLLFVLLGYGLCMFTSQIAAMAIYVFTSHNERKKNAVKFGIYAVLAIFILYILIPVFQNQNDFLGTAVKSANSLFVSLLPVAGWLKAAVVGCMTGDIIMALTGFSATGLLILVLLFAITKAHSDFYEDVLQATEVSFSAITAKKEGNLDSIAPQNVKVGKQGIGKGQGSSAFFYKHMLESRRSKLLFLDKLSLLFLAVNLGFAFMMRDSGLMPVLFFSTYLQIFNISAGRWVRELKRPFVYLTPEPPFFKLIFLCLESIYQMIAESILLFAALGMILHLSVLQMISCMIMRIGFGLLLIAGNILIKRVFGSITSQMVLLMLYFFMILLLCAPGVIVGVILMVKAFPNSFELALLSTFVWNSFASALIMFLCRNILNYAELNDR